MKSEQEKPSAKKQIRQASPLLKKLIAISATLANSTETAQLIQEIETTQFEFKIKTEALSEPLVQAKIVSDSKQMEAQLTQPKYFFEQMFMQSSMSIQILDAEGWCEKINSKFSETFGVKPEHIEGKLYNIFQNEELKRTSVISHLKNVFYKGKPCTWEAYYDIGLTVLSQNNEVKKKKKAWYQNWAYPIFNQKGKLTNVII